ncbi:MAG: pyrroline-5-carboxylate reductase [bacterium]|nr:pyrroline-5-carboxylate reductase [bacterium]
MTANASQSVVAVVGAGNMGGCLLTGLLAAGMPASQLIAIDLREELLAPLAQQGVATSAHLAAAAKADIVVIALKPQAAPGVLPLLAGQLHAGQIVVSVMAGLMTARIETHLPVGQAVVRVMPQTLVQLGAGATAVCAGASADAAAINMVRELFDRVGTTVAVSESQMDAVTGLSGSGPAYIYLVIEALADGGVRAGLPRDVALQLAAQTVAGAGRMVLETRTHPAVLKDQVTSPAGTTIAGLTQLEEGGVRHAFIAAVDAATRRSRELGNA